MKIKYITINNISKHAIQHLIETDKTCLVNNIIKHHAFQENSHLKTISHKNTRLNIFNKFHFQRKKRVTHKSLKKFPLFPSNSVFPSSLNARLELLNRKVTVSPLWQLSWTQPCSLDARFNRQCRVNNFSCFPI